MMGCWAAELRLQGCAGYVLLYGYMGETVDYVAGIYADMCGVYHVLPTHVRVKQGDGRFAYFLVFHGHNSQRTCILGHHPQAPLILCRKA